MSQSLELRVQILEEAIGRLQDRVQVIEFTIPIGEDTEAWDNGPDGFKA